MNIGDGQPAARLEAAKFFTKWRMLVAQFGFLNMRVMNVENNAYETNGIKQFNVLFKELVSKYRFLVHLFIHIFIVLMPHFNILAGTQKLQHQHCSTQTGT